MDEATRAVLHWYLSPEWWTAIFTAALFLATLLLWIFTALMWRTTRDEFSATHRPKLRLRNLGLDTGPIGVVGQALPMEVDINVCNVGDAEASSIKIIYVLKFAPEPSDIAEAFREDDHAVLQFDSKLQPGGVLSASIPYVPPAGVPNELHVLHRGGWKLFLVGRLTYLDKRSVRRTTGFFRVGIQANAGRAVPRFESVPDFDYEYED